MPAVFTHDNASLLGGREDVVTTMNAIEATVSQATTFVTLGVTDRFDVSLAVPIVSNYLKVVSDATIHRLGTTNPLTHFFRQANGEVGERRHLHGGRQRQRLGDIMVRVKGNVRKERPSSALAVGLDVRLPTGDEMNLLGSGAPGLQPFGIWSGDVISARVAARRMSSYKWNGSSVLAGNPGDGRVSAFPVTSSRTASEPT